MSDSRNDNAKSMRRLAASVAASLLFLATVAPVFAATAGVNATTEVNANTDALKNSAGAAINTPAVREAVDQAAIVAKSPELHAAVQSFWRTAWNASWPYISGLVQKFFGLFVIAWDVIARQPKSLNANVNTSANARLNINASQ